MPCALATALVLVTSAAVLVLEIVVMRLVAPYVGLTLETYTAAIGVALAGIAGGAAAGETRFSRSTRACLRWIASGWAS